MLINNPPLLRWASRKRFYRILMRSCIILPLFGVAVCLVLGGCATSNPTRGPDTGLVDSLRTANQRLARQLRTVHDSLRFYDDIYAGQYWRDRRRLHNRIDRLRYELTRCREGGRTVSTFRTDALFEPASATLTAAGKARLDSLVGRLQEQFSEQTLRIEGHTDDVPIGSSLRDKYPSNWELSAARAGAVLRYLTGSQDLAPERFTLVGYGPTRPVARNSTAAGRRKNRRVRIAVLPEEPR